MTVNPATTIRKLISLPHEMVEAINDFRYQNRIGTETEAIRQLLQRGLRATASSPAVEPSDAAPVQPATKALAHQEEVIPTPVPGSSPFSGSVPILHGRPLPTTTEGDVLLDEEAAARFVCMSRRTLQRFRDPQYFDQRDTPVFVRVGRRRVLYRLSDLRAWLGRRSAAPVHG